MDLIFNDNNNLKGEKEEPTSYLWLLYFLAKLYDFNGDHMKALEFIDEAIQHTPTVVDLLHQKAKIYKVSINVKIR